MTSIKGLLPLFFVCFALIGCDENGLLNVRSDPTGFSVFNESEFTRGVGIGNNSPVNVEPHSGKFISLGKGKTKVTFFASGAKDLNGKDVKTTELLLERGDRLTINKNGGVTFLSTQ